MINLSVIIPTYKRNNSLARLLDSLADQTLGSENFEVIVVDDGSPSKLGNDYFEKYDFSWKYLWQENQGATIARNNGAIKSSGETLLFIDDDVSISANALESLDKACKKHSKTIALGWITTCNANKGSTFTKLAVYLDNKDLNRFKVSDGYENYTECNTQLIALRKQDFIELGMFQDPTGGWPNWDDLDLGYRAHLAGYNFVRVGEAKGKHWDQSLSNMKSSSQRWYRASKSAVRLFQKYPELQSSLMMYRDKTPVKWGQDQPDLILRKMVRHAASVEISILFMETAAKLLETVSPSPKLLLPLYRWIFGAYMFQGYQQGLRDYGMVPESGNP